MENVSKALIMAGGLLISILVASFMVFVLRKAGSLSAEYDTQISDNELAKFNSQFEIYAKENNTFFDVITAANLAYDINKRTGYDEQNGVTVTIVKDNGTVEYSVLPKELPKDYFFEGENENKPVYIYNNLNGESIIEKYTARKSDDTDYLYRFDCTKANSIGYNDITGKVNRIEFTIENN